MGKNSMGVFSSKEMAEPKGEMESKNTVMLKVKELVSGQPVVVFSKTYCPYCVRVKKLLSNMGAKMTVVELDVERDGSEIQAALGEWTGQRTVPNVFIAGKHVGGCDDTTSLHKQGKLVPMLQEAQAVATE